MPDKILLHPLHLPNEILGIIINLLASGDEETLSALASCRLASHVVCSLATPLYFSSIQLTDSADHTDCSLLGKQATKLSQILSVYNIAASVHTLTLRCHRESLQNSTDAILISTLLHRLPHIRNFTLETVMHRRFIYFYSIPKNVASAIRILCRSPNLTTLYLNNIDGFPFEIITASPTLRCLRLRDIASFQFNNVRPSDEISIPQLLYLDSLEMDITGIETLGLRISRDKSIGKHFSRIKTLQLEDLFSVDWILHYGWDIMLLASQTLTTLALPMTRQDAEDSRFSDPGRVLEFVPFDLGRFPALRHLKIQRWSPYRDYLIEFRFLTRLLSISSSPIGIETLEIEITRHSVRDEHGKDLFSSDAGWSTLDQLLISETFGSLRKVVLRLRLEMEMDSSSEKVLCNDSDQHISELEKISSLTHVNDLFPLFRTLTDAQRTLETHFEVVQLSFVEISN